VAVTTENRKADTNTHVFQGTTPNIVAKELLRLERKNQEDHARLLVKTHPSFLFAHDASPCHCELLYHKHP
jgi:hypothetical protein